MEVASAGMATYGNTFEEIIGLVTSGSEIMVGKSLQVARGLSTIAARIVKNQSAVESYGITVENADGSLKSTYDILTELKPKWDAMTDAQRTALGDTIAGTNQYKVLAAVMQNFSHATDATETALNSSGSASKENEKYMESLEAKVTALEATFQDFSNNVLSRDFVGAILSTGNTLLNFANNDVGATITQMVLLGGTAMGIVGIIGQVGTKIAEVISLIKTTGVLGASGWGLVIGGAVAALTGLIAVIKGVKDAIDSANPSFEELQSEISNLADKTQAAQDRLEEIYKIPWADRTSDIKNEQLALEAEVETYKELIASKKEAAAIEAGETYNQYERTQYRVTAPEARGTVGQTYSDLRSAVYGLAGELNVSLVDAETGVARSLGAIKSDLEDLGYVFEETTDTVTMSDDEIKSSMSDMAIAFSEIQEQLDSGKIIYDEAQERIVDLTGKYPDLIDKIRAMVEAEDSGIYTIGENSDVMHSLIDTLDSLESAMDGARNSTSASTQDFINHTHALITAKTQGVALVNTIKQENQQLISEKVQASLTANAIKSYVAAIVNSNSVSIDVAQKIAALQQLRVAAINAAIAVNMAAQQKGANISSTYLDPWQRGGYGANTSGTLSASDAAQLRKYYESFVTTPSTGGYSGGSSGGGGGGSSSGSSSSEDAYLKEFELWLKAKKHALEMDEITESQYYADLKVMNDRYFKGKNDYLEEYWKYQEEIYKYEKSQTKENLQQQLDALSDLEDAINEKYDNELSKLKEVNSELEDQIKYEQLLADMAEARNKKQLVYKDGRWQYMSNVDAIASAKSKLDEYYRDKDLTNKQEQIEARRNAELAEIAKQQTELNEKLSKLTGYANGSTYTRGGLSLVGENGPELRVVNSGDGVLPSTVTKNLWKWGSMSPNSLSTFGNMQSGRTLSFNNVNMSFPNVHSASDASRFVQNLTNLAYQYSYKRS